MDKTKRVRESKGCTKPVATRGVRIENIIFKKCPGNFNTPIPFLLESFAKYNSNMLTFEGSLSDQPNKLIEILKVMEQRKEYHKERST